MIQLIILTILRISIGWHLLYEGLVKIINPGWSSYNFLMDSKGVFASSFHYFAQQENILYWIDISNKWLLTVIGLMLILGFFTRVFAILGGILLLTYYASHPPFPGVEFLMQSEGSYLWVNKILIEAIALFLFATIERSNILGLDMLFVKKKDGN